MLKETKDFISNHLDMKDMGQDSFVIGIEIHRDISLGSLKLSQRYYISNMLRRFSTENCPPRKAHIIKGDDEEIARSRF